MRISYPLATLHGLLAVSLLVGCQSRSSSDGTAPASSPAPSPDAPLWFVEVAPAAGIRWQCLYGTDETDYILETTGPGPAWFDYDNDGDMDLLLLNGWHFDPDTIAKYRPRAALFRNEGDGSFTEVTDSAGVGFVGWGTTSLAADFDNDGWVDLFVSAWGRNVLYRNNGDGTFSDVTDRAGLGDTLYGASGCALDYDRDGLLDIFVANYVPFDTATAEKPGTTRYTIVRGLPMSQAPEGYPGAPDRLYHNNGDGTFTDVAAEAGLNGVLGRGLGAISLDYDDDGWPDIYVANDAMQNFLYRNNGDGTFSEVATMIGAAYGEGGMPAGSMGLASGDIDLDGWPEIIVANYENQTASVYHNERGRFFTERSVPSGIGAASLVPLQWGTVLADFDLDGDEDLYLAGGHVTSRLEGRYPQSAFAQRNQLYLNDGHGRFREVGARCGPGLAEVYGSRGAAGADYDNDGDIDIAVINKSGPASLLRNDTPRKGHWLRLVLKSTRSAPNGIGAKVRLLAGGRWQMRRVRAGSSYASTEDVRPLFGLGSATAADSIVIRWPSGQMDRLADVPADRTIHITEGGGYEVAARP